MSLQLNVAQQIALRKSQIAEVARHFSKAPEDWNWIREMLKSRGHDPSCGALVGLSSVPSNQGDSYRGTWLTDQHQFWEFEAEMVCAKTNVLIEQVEFRNVTSETPILDKQPGIGMSFGQVALEVLFELRQNRSPSST
jgi:hypothetical protein